MSEPTKTFYVIGPGCWGKGSTLAAARRNAKRNAPSFARKPVTFHGYVTDDPDAYITDTGSLRYSKRYEFADLGIV